MACSPGLQFAFTVRWRIHLLFRNRFELRTGGAMIFLEALIRQNRRRMQLQKPVVVLVRCAFDLIGLCMAVPC